MTLIAAELQSNPLSVNVLQSPERRDFLVTCGKVAGLIALGGAGGAIEFGGEYALTHPGAATLDLNLAISAVSPPEAPIIENLEAPYPVRRVERSYNNLITHFATRNGMFLDNNRDNTIGSNGEYATVWSFSAALRALGAARAITGTLGENATTQYADSSAQIEQYWLDGPRGYDAGYLPGPRAYGDFSQRYLDDNGWVGNKHMLDNSIRPNKLAVGRAKEVATLGVSQWDTKYGGGMPWRQRINGDITSRVLVANMTMAQLMVRLYTATGNKAYYHPDRSGQPDATMVTGWVDENLRASNGLYSDGKGIDGSMDPHQWTYGIGTVIGTKSALNKLDPQRYPFGEIVELATKSLHAMKGSSALLYPNIAYDDIQDNAFNAIYFSEIFDLIDQHGLSEDNPLTVLALNKLQACVDQLSDDPYSNLLQQAGALQLAVMGALRLPESKYTAF